MAAASFDDQFLQSLLEEIAEKQGFKQPKFSISLGSKPGDNFIGRIFRALITETNSEKSLSLIFKVSAVSKARQEKTNSAVLFRTEADVYETVLPTLNNLLNKYGVVKSGIFPGTARCYGTYIDDVPSQVIVLEDKSVEGFGMIGDSKSMDADHCRKILKYLALWHAASLALKHHEPETAERFQKLLTKETFFTDPNSHLLGELVPSAYEGLTFLQEPFKKGNAVYEKLENIARNLRNETANVNKIPDDLSCIIHGDCWFNNFLYKYKDGNFEDACLIDLQFSRVASPVVDISFMMFFCTTKDVRDVSYDDLVRCYHEEVSSNLKMMACDPEKLIPWTTLQEHFRKYGKIGIIITMACLHVDLADSSDNSVDLYSAGDDGNVFGGRVKSWTSEKREEISRRLTGIIEDGIRWEYI